MTRSASAPVSHGGTVLGTDREEHPVPIDDRRPDLTDRADEYTPDPTLVHLLIEGLCDEAWHGRLDLNAAGLNTRPQAAVIAPAVLRALHDRGYAVIRREPAGR